LQVWELKMAGSEKVEQRSLANLLKHTAYQRLWFLYLFLEFNAELEDLRPSCVGRFHQRTMMLANAVFR